MNTLGGVGGPQLSDSHSETSDPFGVMNGAKPLYGGFGILAGFSGRERSEQEKPVSAEKNPEGSFSDVFDRIGGYARCSLK